MAINSFSLPPIERQTSPFPRRAGQKRFSVEAGLTPHTEPQNKKVRIQAIVSSSLSPLPAGAHSVPSSPPLSSKSSGDRYIPERRVLTQPSAQTADLPLPPPPSSFCKAVFDRNLCQAAHGCDTAYGPILRIPKKAPPSLLTQWPAPLPRVERMLPERQMWDLPGISNSFYGHPICMSKDQRFLAIALLGFQIAGAAPGTRSAKIFFQDLENNQPSELLAENEYYPVNQSPTCVALNEKRTLLAVGRSDGSVDVWAIAEKPYQRIRTIPLNPAGRMNTLAFRGDKQLYIGDNQGKVHLVNAIKGKIQGCWENLHTGQICSLVISPDGRFIATGGGDNKLLVYHAKTMEVIKVYTLNAAVRGIAFHPDNLPWIAFGGGAADSRIFVCHFLGDEKDFATAPTGSQVTEILWPKKSRLISTHQNGTIRIYPLNLSTLQRLGDPHIVPSHLPSMPPARVLFAAFRKQGDSEFLMLQERDILHQLALLIPKKKSPVKEQPFESFNQVR